MGSLTHFGYLSFILVSKPLENTISNAFSHDMPVIIIIIIKHTPKNRCKERSPPEAQQGRLGHRSPDPFQRIVREIQSESVDLECSVFSC